MTEKKAIRSVLSLILIFACVLSLGGSAMAAEKNTSLDQMFYLIQDEKTGNYSLAFAAELSGSRYLIYSDSSLDPKATYTAENSSTNERYELSFLEDLGSVYSWEVKNPKSRPRTHAMRGAAAPVLGERVQVVYVGSQNGNYAFISVERTLSTLSAKYDDGTAQFLLNDSINDLEYAPGLVLNTRGECVGVLTDSSTVYSDFYSLKSSVSPSPTVTPKPTVKPYSGYLYSASQITQSNLRRICKQMEELISSNVALTWTPQEHLLCSEYVGVYLLSLKSGYSGAHNMLILVYRNDVNIRDKSLGIDKSLSYYYTIQYDNVTIDESGYCQFGEYSKPHGTVYTGLWDPLFYYNGYATQNELYKELISPNTKQYTVTSIGDLDY